MEASDVRSSLVPALPASIDQLEEAADASIPGQVVGECPARVLASGEVRELVG